MNKEEFSAARMGAADFSEYMTIKREKDRMRETLSDVYQSNLLHESNLVSKLIEKTERIDAPTVTQSSGASGVGSRDQKSVPKGQTAKKLVIMAVVIVDR